MSSKVKLTVPDEIQRYFLLQNMLEVEVNSFENDKEILLKTPFLYDLLALQNEKPPIKPWEQWESSIPYLLDKWKGLCRDITVSFQNRKGKADKNQMLFSIGLYLLIIHWLNNSPLKANLQSFSSFLYKPINIEDRISFILKKPEQYHSFIQLQELFLETEKLFYKRKAMSNKKAITKK